MKVGLFMFGLTTYDEIFSHNIIYINK